MFGVIAPRSAIVHRHSLRQSIPSKRGPHLRLDRFRALIRTCFQTYDEPGMVIQNRQRMTSNPAAPHRKPALEIHLPELIRLGMFESLPRCVFGRLFRIDPLATPQDSVDRAVGWNLNFPDCPQSSADFPGTPRRMTIPHLQYSALHIFTRSIR